LRRNCFVHAAALRLDQPFEGVGVATPAVSAALVAASVDAWDELVRLSIARRAAFFVLAGGLFGDEIGVRAQARLRRGLLRLGEHGVQVFVALGAGEAGCREWFAAHDWPSSLTVFPADRPFVARVVRDGTHVATVAGQSCDGELPLDALLAALPADAAPPLVAVVPCAGADLGFDVAAPDRAPAAVDYWALGGSAGTSRLGFHPWIVSPGPLQARDGAESHLGPRGAMVADIHDDRVVAVELAELDRVRWLRIELGAGRRGLRDDLSAELLKLRAAHAGRGLVVDIEVSNVARAELPSARRQLLAELRQAVRSWEPFVWCNSLRFLPTSESDFAATWQRDELAATVVQQSRALLGNPLQRSVFLAQRCEPLLRRWTAEMEVDETEALIGEAARLAVDTLVAEEPQ
jgi:hypothetical protein